MPDLLVFTGVFIGSTAMGLVAARSVLGLALRLMTIPVQRDTQRG